MFHIHFIWNVRNLNAQKMFILHIRLKTNSLDLHEIFIGSIYFNELKYIFKMFPMYMGW